MMSPYTIKVNKLILIGRHLANNHKIITYGLEIPNVDMKNILEYHNLMSMAR